jgi:hypothetical protein
MIVIPKALSLLNTSGHFAIYSVAITFGYAFDRQSAPEPPKAHPQVGL